MISPILLRYKYLVQEVNATPSESDMNVPLLEQVALPSTIIYTKLLASKTFYIYSATKNFTH